MRFDARYCLRLEAANWSARGNAMTALERYVAWKRWHADLTEKLDGRHQDWVGAVVGLTNEVMRDCNDVSVTGWARLARMHVLKFAKAKQAAKIPRDYSKFFNHWGRLGTALAAQITMRSSTGLPT